MTAAPRASGTVRPTAALAAEVEAKNASYREIAAAVGCSHQRVHQIVTGRQPTSTELATKIADFLEAPVSRLFRHKNGDLIGSA